MPHKSVKLSNATLKNFFRARQVSQMLGLGNAIQKKRLNATLKSLPTQVTKGLKTLGLTGGKRRNKTRKARRGSKTRRH